MCHSDSRLPAAGVGILTNILEGGKIFFIFRQIDFFAVCNFWTKMGSSNAVSFRRKARDF